MSKSKRSTRSLPAPVDPSSITCPVWSVTKGPEDWIIWCGPRGTGSWALGPVTQGWSIRRRYETWLEWERADWRSLGTYTSFPHYAIGWATREEAQAVIDSLHPDTKGSCSLHRRKTAVARFERVRGGELERYREGVADWGTSKG
jgi:hypothetical protein